MINPLSLNLMHSDLSVSSNELLNLLKSGGYFKSDAQMNRIIVCGQIESCLELYYDCGHVIKPMMTCNSRICPLCSIKLKARKKRNIRPMVLYMKNPRFLTLTSRAYKDEEYSKKSYEDNQRTWRRVRQALEREGYVINHFVNAIETVYHSKGDPKKDRRTGEVIGFYESSQWMIHNHIIYDGDYIPQDLIVSLMRRVTKGRSYIVNIKLVGKGDCIREKMRAFNYICKYVGKCELPSKDPRLLARFYIATRHVHLLSTSQFYDWWIPSDKGVCPICLTGRLAAVFYFKTKNEELAPGLILQRTIIRGLDQVLEEISLLNDIDYNIELIEEMIGINRLIELKEQGLVYESKIGHVQVIS